MKLSDVDIDRLRQLRKAATKAVAAVDQEAARARAKGATWTELGYALGISAQAAQKKYGTGSERAQAYEEAQAESALKRRRRAAKRASGAS